MRNFNVHPNNSNLKPGVNLNKLWSLVSEQVLTNRMIATSYDQPLLRFFSRVAEEKMKAVGGAFILTAH